MSEPVASGHPCWVDLSTPDVDAAEHFYRELLGWTIRTDQTPMGAYHVASVGDREVAGMMAQPAESAGRPAAWTVFVYVDDLDATTTEITEAGGAVLAPAFEIPDGTVVSVVADRGGAMFALISARPQPGPYLSRAVGAVSWVELMTRAPASAERFYGRVFGWKATTQDAAAVPYATFHHGGLAVAGMIATPPDLANAPDSWSAYFTVADCHAAVDEVVQLGGQVLLTPTTTPVGPFAVVADPTGAVFQIMEYTDASM